MGVVSSAWARAPWARTMPGRSVAMGQQCHKPDMDDQEACAFSARRLVDVQLLLRCAATQLAMIEPAESAGIRTAACRLLEQNAH